MRSWRPFCWGLPGSMSSGVMPSRSHQALSLERRASAMEAKGVPLSVRIRSGRPWMRKTFLNTRIVASSVVPYSPRHSSKKRLWPSWMVRG